VRDWSQYVHQSRDKILSEIPLGSRRARCGVRASCKSSGRFHLWPGHSRQWQAIHDLESIPTARSSDLFRAGFRSAQRQSAFAIAECHHWRWSRRRGPQCQQRRGLPCCVRDVETVHTCNSRGFCTLENTVDIGRKLSI
jgi:hypothetical protein